MPKRDLEDFLWRGGYNLTTLSVELRQSLPRVVAKRTWEPRVDLTDEADRLVLKVELAGIRHDDVELVYVPDKHAVVVRGSRVEDAGSEQQRVGAYQLEILYGEFEREISMPIGVEISPDSVRAMFQNGMLIALFPKS